jgi:hypothetical protein
VAECNVGQVTGPTECLDSEGRLKPVFRTEVRSDEDFRVSRYATRELFRPPLLLASNMTLLGPLGRAVVGDNVTRNLPRDSICNRQNRNPALRCGESMGLYAGKSYPSTGSFPVLPHYRSRNRLAL